MQKQDKPVVPRWQESPKGQPPPRSPQLSSVGDSDATRQSPAPLRVTGTQRSGSFRSDSPSQGSSAATSAATSAAIEKVERHLAPNAQRRRSLQHEAHSAVEAAREVTAAARKQREEIALLSKLTKLLQPPLGRGNFGRLEVRRPKSSADDSDVLFEEITFNQAIGAGSFGAVWRGECRGEVVAIKKCKVGDPKDAEMLLMEVRYLQKLRHPRLVSYMGCCNRPPHILMLIEFMEGGSLHGLIFGKGRKVLPFIEKLRMTRQVSEGLVYLHEISIVHRDLKTMNIVLDKELNCKICDFGLTLTLDSTHMTVKSLQGSPRYMAPEQFETSARISEKVDIWQMGCVMLEFFCVKMPFADAKGVQQVATELLVRRRPPAPPADADPRARTLIQACLRIEPKQRPGSDVLERALLTTQEACEVTN